MTDSGGELGDQEGRLPVPGGVPGGEAATSRGAPSPARRGSIAYVLTAFPRLSETFIASEVHRLEQRGLRLRLFVLKSDDPSEPHPVVRRIAARPDYLPPTTSLSRTPLLRWLAANLPSFLPGLLRTARRRPVGVARAAWAALRQSLRARRPGAWPPKVYVKDFLRASEVVDRLHAAGDVRHLHAHFCHGTTTVTWLASMMSGVPFSFTAHARDLYNESLNPAGLLGRKLRAARFAVTCTEANRSHLARIANGVPVHRVYHGLNADLAGLLKETPVDIPPAGHTVRALGVGRLVPKKGFDVLVDACALLRQAGLAVDATIAGQEGSHAAEVRRRIARHGLGDAVHLAGPLAQAALLREYRRATVFCLPCRVAEDGDRDGIPNVLVEAMACGLAVVTTPISGIPELVADGETGIIVPPDDPEALAAAVMRLHRDTALAGRLGRAAQALVRERFDGEQLATVLAGLFWPLVAS